MARIWLPIILIPAAALGADLALPYWTIHQMRSAAAEGDAEGVMAFVDVGALRSGLLEDAKAEAAKDLVARGGDGFALLGQAGALDMMTKTLEGLLTQQALQEMIIESDATGGSHGKVGADDAIIVRDSFDQFRLKDSLNFSMIFHRSGLGWKMVAMRAPHGAGFISLSPNEDADMIEPAAE